MKQEMQRDSTQPKGKQFEGRVVSTKMTKTVIVAVVHERRHPLYKKSMKKTRRYAVHNESFSLSVGDRVLIGETKPVSKTKHFTIISKL